MATGSVAEKSSVKWFPGVKQLNNYWEKLEEKAAYKRKEPIHYFYHNTILKYRRLIMRDKKLEGSLTTFPESTPLSRNENLVGVWFDITLMNGRLPNRSPYGSHRIKVPASELIKYLSRPVMEHQEKDENDNIKKMNDHEVAEGEGPQSEEGKDGAPEQREDAVHVVEDTQHKDIVKEGVAVAEAEECQSTPHTGGGSTEPENTKEGLSEVQNIDGTSEKSGRPKKIKRIKKKKNAESAENEDPLLSRQPPEDKRDLAQWLLKPKSPTQESDDKENEVGKRQSVVHGCKGALFDPLLFFECVYHFSNNSLYVRLILIRPDHPEVAWCLQNTKQIDIRRNPFLQWDGKKLITLKNGEFSQHIYVEVFVAGDIYFEELGAEPLWDTAGKSVSAGGDARIGLFKK